ncbi:MAG: RsmE family RNA methyltransferase, partial [Firmicutes bacterium]|nr:RsmE family RNA methyltransferase [Bacillota bacterium]
SSNLVQAFVETPKKVAVFIGPEGGLSKDEVDKLQVLTYTLGPRILRTETAGIVALAHLMFGLEMKGENYI